MKFFVERKLGFVIYSLFLSWIIVAVETTSILNYPLGARVNAMGNTYAGLSADVFSSYLNSGLLGMINRKEVGFATAILYENTIMNYFGYVHPTVDYGNFAVGVSHLTSWGAKETNEYNQFTGNEFSFNSVLFNFCWGREIIRKFYTGGNAKFVSNSLYTYSQNFFTTNIGIIYLVSSAITLGANFNNLFTLTLSDTEDKLPLGVNFGLGIKPFETFILGIDVGKRKTGSSLLDTYSFGLETSIWKMFNLRAGRNNLETTLGFGVIYKNINFDYALVLQDYLGSTHRISLDFKFGKTLEELWAEKIKGMPTAEDIEIVEAKLQTEEEKKKYFQTLLEEGIRDATRGYIKQALSKFTKAKEVLPEATDVDIYIDRVSLVASFYTTIPAQGDINSKILRGVRYFINGDNVNSVKLLSYALSKSPENRTLARLLTKIEEKTGIRAEKIELPSGRTIVDQKHNEALIAFRKKDYARVVALCDEILFLEPEDAEAYKKLGSAFYAMGEKEKAIKMWEQALSLDKKDTRLAEFIKRVKESLKTQQK